MQRAASLRLIRSPGTWAARTGAHSPICTPPNNVQIVKQIERCTNPKWANSDENAKYFAQVKKEKGVEPKPDALKDHFLGY
jgi:hypothetical protein